MIDRIFSGAVTRGSAQQAGKMSYTDFVWFLLAEEDKRHPTAIEYWYKHSKTEISFSLNAALKNSEKI